MSPREGAQEGLARVDFNKQEVKTVTEAKNMISERRAEYLPDIPILCRTCGLNCEVIIPANDRSAKTKRNYAEAQYEKVLESLKVIGQGVRI
jgi:hypothetical protein